MVHRCPPRSYAVDTQHLTQMMSLPRVCHPPPHVTGVPHGLLHSAPPLPLPHSSLAVGSGIQTKLKLEMAVVVEPLADSLMEKGGTEAAKVM